MEVRVTRTRVKTKFSLGIDLVGLGQHVSPFLHVCCAIYLCIYKKALSFQTKMNILEIMLYTELTKEWGLSVARH